MVWEYETNAAIRNSLVIFPQLLKFSPSFQIQNNSFHIYEDFLGKFQPSSTYSALPYFNLSSEKSAQSQLDFLLTTYAFHLCDEVLVFTLSKYSKVM